MYVKEYATAALTLSDEDRDFLLALTKGSSDRGDDAQLLESISPTRQDDTYEIMAGPFIGRLGLPSGAWVDFQSRFEFDDLVSVLRYAGHLPIRSDELEAAASSEPFFAVAIATAFAREVERIIGGGLAKGYRPFRQTRPPFGGRIDVSYHLGRMGARPDLLATSVRRLTTDLPENQALLQALEVLRRVPLPEDVSRRLHHALAAFGPVSLTHLRPEDLQRITLTNLTRRYEPALALAELILRGRSLAPVGAAFSGGTLLFDMTKVWESFVARWAQERFPDCEVRVQDPFALTNDGRLAYADVTVWRESRLVALFDAKYKWPKAQPERSDLYQMVTYCDRLGIDEATLVYPVAVNSRSVGVGSKLISILGLVPSEVLASSTSSTGTSEHAVEMAGLS